LLSAGYVFALLVVTQVRKLRKVPFALSWWALSFPVAALSIASFGYAHEATSVAHQWIGATLLAVLYVMVVGLVLRTGKAAIAGEICVPE